MALTVPSFLVGGLAGSALGTGHATWPDIAYLLAPAIIALIQALAQRIAANRRAIRGSRHAAP